MHHQELEGPRDGLPLPTVPRGLPTEELQTQPAAGKHVRDHQPVHPSRGQGCRGGRALREAQGSPETLLQGRPENHLRGMWQVPGAPSTCCGTCWWGIWGVQGTCLSVPMPWGRPPQVLLPHGGVRCTVCLCSLESLRGHLAFPCSATLQRAGCCFVAFQRPGKPVSSPDMQNPLMHSHNLCSWGERGIKHRAARRLWDRVSPMQAPAKALGLSHASITLQMLPAGTHLISRVIADWANTHIYFRSGRASKDESKLIKARLSFACAKSKNRGGGSSSWWKQCMHPPLASSASFLCVRCMHVSLWQSLRVANVGVRVNVGRAEPDYSPCESVPVSSLQSCLSLHGCKEQAVCRQNNAAKETRCSKRKKEKTVISSFFVPRRKSRDVWISWKRRGKSCWSLKWMMIRKPRSCWCVSAMQCSGVVGTRIQVGMRGGG